MRTILKEGFDALGLELTDTAAQRFSQYYALLSEKNKVMNLTAITGEEDVARLHFLDCAALCAQYAFAGKSVIDVGTGAGFPGLPIKIVCPDVKLTLLDSQQKRIGFLGEVCGELDFPEVTLLHSRAEEETALFGSFDVAVSRAVARLNILCELCLPFVKRGGVFIAMKGSDYAAELKEAENAIKTLGGGDCEVKSYLIPGTDRQTHAIIITKAADTPPLYPRPFGKIKKSPL